MQRLLGGIEAGGTKFVCVVGSAGGEIIERARFDTRAPAATLADVIGFFRDAEARRGPLAAFGVASFGPLDLDSRSPTFGSITRTPKPHWSGVSLTAPLREHFGRPVAIDTDVNGAAVAEARWGAGVGQRTVVYVTAGTGIGGGIAIDAQPVPGLIHPEMGHLRVPRHPYDQDFRGVCPFHGDCVEGLVSGPAVVTRWGQRLDQLPSDHPAREIIGFYLGQLCASIALMISPGVIVLGGGLTTDGTLYPAVRAAAREQLAGYLQHTRLNDSFDDFIVAPGLKDTAGAMGALALAERARLEH
jgi:fructokinase